MAIEALALYRRDAAAELHLVGPVRPKELRHLEEQVWKLGLSEFVKIHGPLGKNELSRHYHESDAVVAPLIGNDRNLVQGCCPLKVLEAMACGTPLIASDLPVVAELVEAESEALLVRASSAKSIKDAMFRVLNDPAAAKKRSRAARVRVEQTYDWRHAQHALLEVYQTLFDECPEFNSP